MRLHWTFTYNGEPQRFNLSELGDEIMPEFGLEQRDYKVVDDHIYGTPNLHADRIATPIRLSVSTIRVRPEKEDSAILIEIKFYKLFMLPLFFSAFIIAVNGFGELTLALVTYIATVLFLGIMTLVSLLDTKHTIKKKINQLPAKSESN